MRRMHDIAVATVAVLGISLAPIILRAAPPTWDHVVVVIEENHGYSQIIGSAQAPYINSLAAGGASLTNMFATTHPSQPNYLDLFSGSVQGVTNDSVPPAGSPYTTPNMAAELRDAGQTFAIYSENLPSVGSTVGSSNGYVRKHNPVVDWQSATPTGNQLPASMNQPFSNFPSDYSTLPTVSYVVPTQANDMHDGTVQQGDTWLQNNLGAYAAWAQSHNSLLVVTFDEDGGADRNRIPTIFYGAHVAPGTTVAGTWTAHNLLHTIEDAYGTAHAGNSAEVQSIVGAFTSDPSVSNSVFQHGFNGYTGTVDTYIEQANPNAQHGSDAFLGAGGTPLQQMLIRFDNIFGNGPGQIPLNCHIVSAKLDMWASGPAPIPNPVSIYQLTVPFDATSTWNSLGGGITIGGQTLANPDFTMSSNATGSDSIFDVTDTLRHWRSGAPNYGWMLQNFGTTGAQYVASDFSFLPSFRPRLDVVWTVPEPSSLCLGALGAIGLIAWAKLKRR